MLDNSMITGCHDNENLSRNDINDLTEGSQGRSILGSSYGVEEWGVECAVFSIFHIQHKVGGG